MIDLIKKTVLAGIGATVITKEKIESVMQDLVKQGKVSSDEAKNLASKIADEGRKEWESSSKDLAERIRELLAKADFAHKTEVAQLERRLQLLEEKVEAMFKLPSN
jgi:polyhydroxyalkanoate synthesis regulator phasin